MIPKLRLSCSIIGIGVALFALAGCDGPPVETKQQGYRGLGMEQVDSPKRLAALQAQNRVPKADPPAQSTGPRASAEYKNLQVLGNVSVDEFNRLMLAITEWVAPDQGCAYCHNTENLAADTPMKVVARRMLQMTQTVNSDWKSHVGETGVTCYTCHRGNPVPQNIWYKAPEPSAEGSMLGARAGQNAPAKVVGLTSLPYDPFSAFLEYAEKIRVIGNDALPEKAVSGASIQQTEATYGLMMHMSQALGQNCTFCHNSRSFFDWNQSSQPRINAFHGIRMVRELNMSYLVPLKQSFLPERLGPTGDVPKLNCATCHQGANKPLLGVNMLKDYRELAQKK